MENQTSDNANEADSTAGSNAEPPNQSDASSSNHQTSDSAPINATSDQTAAADAPAASSATTAPPTGSVQAPEYYNYQYYGVPPTDPSYAYAYQNYYSQYGQLPAYPTAAPTAQVVSSTAVPAQLPGFPVVGAPYPYTAQYPGQAPVASLPAGVQAPQAVPQPPAVVTDSNSTSLTKEASLSESGGADSDDDPTVLKGKPSTKKNNVLPFRGDEKTMNLNHLIYTNIIQSPYFKNDLYALKTYHEVIDEIYRQVHHLEPWERGSRRVGGQTGMCGSVRIAYLHFFYHLSNSVCSTHRYAELALEALFQPHFVASTNSTLSN